MIVDIEKARALVEHERASFTRIPYAPVHPRLSRVELVDLIAALLDERDALARKLDAVREVYAGVEGFVPQTAPEGYCLRIIEQMAHATMKGTQ